MLRLSIFPACALLSLKIKIVFNNYNNTSCIQIVNHVIFVVVALWAKERKIITERKNHFFPLSRTWVA